MVGLHLLWYLAVAREKLLLPSHCPSAQLLLRVAALGAGALPAQEKEQEATSNGGQTCHLAVTWQGCTCLLAQCHGRTVCSLCQLRGFSWFTVSKSYIISALFLWRQNWTFYLTPSLKTVLCWCSLKINQFFNETSCNELHCHCNFVYEKIWKTSRELQYKCNVIIQGPSANTGNRSSVLWEDGICSHAMELELSLCFLETWCLHLLYDISDLLKCKLKQICGAEIMEDAFSTTYFFWFEVLYCLLGIRIVLTISACLILQAEP